MTEGYRALRHGAALLDLSARGRILVRGRDRVRLLHNLTSNHIKALVPGAGCYAFLLNPQGRIQADLHLFAFPERFLIDTEPELREKAPAHIRRYIIADQVELEDVTATTSAISVEGPRAAAMLESLGARLPEPEFAHAAWGDRTVAALTVTGQPGARVYCPSVEDAASLAAQLTAAGAVPAEADDVRTVRIENGIPRYGDDIRETTLPQESGRMHAVSFTKGCYLGQEIVERIRAQGHVNKQLRRVELAGDPPEPGARIMVDGNEAEVTSAIRSPETGQTIALAYVRVPRT